MKQNATAENKMPVFISISLHNNDKNMLLIIHLQTKIFFQENYTALYIESDFAILRLTGLRSYEIQITFLKNAVKSIAKETYRNNKLEITFRIIF